MFEQDVVAVVARHQQTLAAIELSHFGNQLRVYLDHRRESDAVLKLPPRIDGPSGPGGQRACERSRIRIRQQILELLFRATLLRLLEGCRQGALATIAIDLKQPGRLGGGRAIYRAEI